MPPGFALTVAIIIWSSSPLLVTKFSGIAPSYYSATFAIWLATLVSLVYSLFNISVLRDVSKFLLAWRTNQKDILRVALLASFAFVLYPQFYFFGLQKGNPIAANLINYTWPIVGILIGVKLSGKVISVESLLGAVLGFCGAGIVLRTSLPTASVVNSTGLLSQDFLPYIIAAGGAISYAAYSGYARVISIPNLKDARSQFVLMLLIASLAQLFIFVVSYFFGFRVSISLDENRGLAFVIYAIGLAIAHFSWLYAVQNMQHERPFIAVYLTPLVSTLLLVIAQTTSPSPIIIPGLLFVLVGIYLSQHSDRPVTPLVATVLLAFVSWAITKIVVDISKTQDINTINLDVNIIQLLLALFAILSGFTLANTIQRNSQQKLEVIECVNCIRKIERHGIQSQKILSSADECLQAILEENFSGGRHYGLMALSKITELEANIGKVQNKQDLETLMAACSELRIRRGTLEYLRIFGVSTYEWFILILLAAVMVALSFSIQSSEFSFILMRTAMVGALTLVLFAIRDYNNGQPGKLRDFIIQSQLTGGATLLFEPYVSRYALLVSDNGNRDLARVNIRTLDDNGNLCRGAAALWRSSIHPSMGMMWLIMAISLLVMFMILV